MQDSALSLLGRAAQLCAACVATEDAALCPACLANIALVVDLRAALGAAEHPGRLALSLRVPMRLVSPMNARESWRAKALRVAAEKQAVTLHLWAKSMRTGVSLLPAHVVLTRRYAGRCARFDTDNAAAAMKAPRDAVAAWLGCDDGDEGRVTWRVGQESALTHAVGIEVWARG